MEDNGLTPRTLILPRDAEEAFGRPGRDRFENPVQTTPPQSCAWERQIDGRYHVVPASSVGKLQVATSSAIQAFLGRSGPGRYRDSAAHGAPRVWTDCQGRLFEFWVLFVWGQPVADFLPKSVPQMRSDATAPMLSQEVGIIDHVEVNDGVSKAVAVVSL
ncbi:hypothetical protein Bbelb_015050 [Branchiostoma belcheri]|nr:hypothetical protein Bbelb_015050 [Branchiostoma belcheri]